VEGTNIPGRREGLRREQRATDRLSREGHPLELQKRPKPK
jgi:hypothetical protein